MLGWLKQKALKSFEETQKREMTEWLDNLAQMNSDEVAAVLCVATHIRHWIETEKRIDLLDPIVTYAAQPTLIISMHKVIRAFQKQGQPTDAAGVMVWLFTLRAGANLALRAHGRRLWRELSRGIPEAEKAQANLWTATRQLLNIEGYDRIPIGLEPDPT